MKIKRREFLHKSAMVVAGVSAAAAGVTAAGFAAEWTAKLKTLNAHEAETLLKMARQIFPHDRLDDSYYIKVVEDLDTEASSNPATAKMLSAGVANLDHLAKGKFSAQPAATIKSPRSKKFSIRRFSRKSAAPRWFRSITTRTSGKFSATRAPPTASAATCIMASTT